jgi:hypothetical protein
MEEQECEEFPTLSFLSVLSFVSLKVPHLLCPAGVGSLPDDAELRVRNEIGKPLVQNMTNESCTTSFKMAIE